MATVVCDTGMGNVFSVVRALEHVGAPSVTVSADPDAIARADRVVFPGQGAFRDCAAALSRDGQGLGDAIRAAIRRGTPYLGICLGLQALFQSSEEAPGATGLGVFPGAVVRLPSGVDEAKAPLKIPHMGWNEARPVREHAILGPAAYYYFVHSYAVAPADRSIVAATTTYGADFPSAVASDNVVAVQFHPEKSQHAGLALLARFAKM